MSIEINGRKVRRFITHNGSFHSDDVFATALLLGWDRQDEPADRFDCVEEYVDYYYGESGIVKPEQVVLVDSCNLSIERVSSEQAAAILADENPDHQDFIMYDVGNTAYDHHKAPRETRENGVPYCAFGKLWRDLKELIGKELKLMPEQLEAFDKDFVQPICLNDNQGIPNVVSLTIKYMNGPDTHDEVDQIERFAGAVDLAQAMLTIWFNNLQEEARAAVEDIIGKESGEVVNSLGQVIMLIYDHEVNPHYVSKFNKEACAVIYPHSRGGWAIESLSDTEIGKSIHNRWTAPKWYWGLNDPNCTDLQAVGAKFCHATGFIMSFWEKEDALNFALLEAGGEDAVLRVH